MLYFCISLKFSSFLQILSLRKGHFHLLPEIIITTSHKTREEKSVKANSIVVKIGRNEQMSHYAPEMSKFCRCYNYGMTLRLQLIFFTCILKINEPRFLYIDP